VGYQKPYALLWPENYYVRHWAALYVAVELFVQSNERLEREREMRAAGRLPPGQSLTLKSPVVHVGSVPLFNPRTWDFRVFGLVEEQLRLSWEELSNLPQNEISADMHCSNIGAASTIIGQDSLRQN